MNRLPSLLHLTGLIIAGFLPLKAAVAPVAPDAPTISTVASSNYSEVTCTSSDALANADTLRLADDAREQLAPLLNLSRHWRFPVHIHIMTPDDPLLAKIPREASAVFSDHGTMRIEAVLPSTDLDARAFIQRQFVTALLWEKFFASSTTFDTHTPLERVPVWLVEGLREWLNDDPEHDRESIVRRAVQIQRAPTLAEITSWPHLSDDRLQSLWQRSFCYYLVESLVRAGPRRDDFQQWLATLASAHSTSAQYLFPTEMGWQKELVDATQRSRDIVYTWDETETDLSSAEVIAIPADKPGDTHICTLETVSTYPRDKKLTVVLQDKLTELTNLELRAHLSWRPILELYRFGLMALINDPTPEKANQFFRQAQEKRSAEMDNHQKLVDYVNWFEVTRDYDGTMSSFESYFATAQDVDRVQADPGHPNQIRANLLQIESEF